MKTSKIFLLIISLFIFSCGDSGEDIKPMGVDISNVIPVTGTVQSIEDGFIISWDKIDGADSYQVQISLTIDFSEVLKAFDNVETKDTSFVVSGVEEGEYYYRVRGKNNINLTSYSTVKTVEYNNELINNDGCEYPNWYYRDFSDEPKSNKMDLERVIFCKTLINEDFAWPEFVTIASNDKEFPEEFKGMHFYDIEKGAYYHTIKFWYSNEENAGGSNYNFAVHIYRIDGSLVESYEGEYDLGYTNTREHGEMYIGLRWFNGKSALSGLSADTDWFTNIEKLSDTQIWIEGSVYTIQ